MTRRIFYLFSFLLFFASCNKQDEPVKKENVEGFEQREDISISDIPDQDLKGYLNGREVTISYVNFEKWRGSKDNVLNFSIVKPEQTCGYIENFQGFQVINKGNAITPGERQKKMFSDDPGTFSANYQYIDEAGNTFKSSSEWTYALHIHSADDKKVKGKIALSFNDEKKSWIAGRFEAILCNN